MQRSIGRLGAACLTLFALWGCGGPTRTDAGTDAVENAAIDGTVRDAMGTDVGIDASLGGFGAACTSDPQCASGVCLSIGRCSRACSSAGDCPTSPNWSCVGLPGGRTACDCAPTGASDLPCNMIDDDCNGLVDDTSRQCGGNCVDVSSNPSHCGGCGIVCGGGSTCAGGVCSCPTVRPLVCGTQCVDPATDIANCGACGRACPAGANGAAACVAGTCSFVCAAGYGDCDMLPANGCESLLRSDPANCGACGRPCSFPNATGVCSTGSCVMTACGPSFANCDGDPTNGCEVDVRVTAGHCGGCGLACSLANATSVCAASACAVSSCTAGHADCDARATDGCEVDTQTDLANCGTCGNICPTRVNASRTCAGGVCGAVCNPGYDSCDGTLVNGCETAVSADASNCGACGNVCPARPAASPTCASGTCGISCTAGFGNCDGDVTNGCEVSLPTDPLNCSTCGRLCLVTNATPACVASACTIGVCNSGFESCNGSSVDGCETNLQADVNNCSACGTACPVRANAARTCTAGACGFACNPTYGNCDGNPTNGCESPTTADPANCGACGNACAVRANAVATCAASTCGIACLAGYGNCNGATFDGCEATFASDPNNCSGCGRVCTAANASSVCNAGVCGVGACTVGFDNCNGLTSDGCEINHQNNVNNCGSCGNVCAGVGIPNTVPACVAGTCSYTCAPGGFADCDGSAVNGCETNTTTSNTNCGACGRVCAGGTVCSAGACVCPAGQRLCSGVCVNTATDSANCGACGNVCAAGTTCSASACVCPAGQSLCGGVCRNTATDPANCGGCNATCAAAAICTAGSCTRANDSCASATPIAVGVGTTTVMGSTLGATSGIPTCTTAPDVYYSFTLARREVVYVDTFGSSYDTELAIATSCAAAITCTDDSCSTTQTQITQVLDPGTYYIVLEGFSGAGYYVLHFQHVPVVGIAAGAIAAGAYTVSGTTVAMPTMAHACGVAASPTSWYQWTTCPTGVAGTVTANTCAGRAAFDTVLSVRNGDGTGACDDNGCAPQSSVSAAVAAGAGLHVLLVSGHDAVSSGAFTVAGTRP